MVHGAPYYTVQALAAWAVAHEPYLRGRLILHGERWDRLTLTEKLDVTYAAIVEPALSGAWTGVSELLDKFDESLTLIVPDEETFGESAAAERGQVAAEEFFGDARGRARRDGKPFRRADALRAERAARARARPVGTGNPMETGILTALQNEVIRAARAAQT